MSTSKPAAFPVRYRVVSFAVSLAALTYLDRVCISILAPDISAEFQLSKQEMSYVFSAITLNISGNPAKIASSVLAKPRASCK